MTKQITLNFSDDIYRDLVRVAKADGRRVTDLVTILLSEGLRFFYCETSITIKKLDSEYSQEEKDQIKKNEELENSEGWSGLDYEARRAKGWSHVCPYLHNEDDFLGNLEERVKESVCNQEVA
nr:hypothetical protein [uncultured Mediterranean phage uvMED]